jgi:predicted RNA-binding protein with PIN domain
VLVIVDGYNLMMAAGEYGAVKGRNLSQARKLLIEDFVLYRRIRKHTIIVVFDAQEAGRKFRSEQEMEGIRVVFSRFGERADDAIVDIAEKNRGLERVVVSSDNEVARSSRRRGAVVVSSEEFLDRLGDALDEYEDMKELGEDIGENVPMGRRSPSRHRSREQVILDKL